MNDPSPVFKSGFVAVVGQPNVGKSTLINALIGTKITAVSPWPQTTRKRQMGILTRDNLQIIFIDTPGVHNPRHKLGEHMVQEASASLEECDLILCLVDASQPPTDEDQLLVDLIFRLKRPVPKLVGLNKIDLVDEDTFSIRLKAYQELMPGIEILPISATQPANLDQLIDTITEYLPEGVAFFPDEQLTDLAERDLTADLIREATLHHLRAEVPHSIAVRIDEYTERNQEGAYIAATLFVERESQKGIVIGQGGMMLKKIGTTAREQIETMTGRKIYLRLRVKVRKNWRNDNDALRLFGFS
jgi:GTP-binding protein Era